MKSKDRRKYKLSICKIDEGVLTYYDSFNLTDVRYDLKDTLRIVDGNDIIAVKVTYNQISV